MISLIPFVVAVMTCLVLCFVMFSDVRDFVVSIVRSLTFEGIQQLFPGFAGPNNDRLRPVLWTISGPISGAVTWYLLDSVLVQ